MSFYTNEFFQIQLGQRDRLNDAGFCTNEFRSGSAFLHERIIAEPSTPTQVRHHAFYTNEFSRIAVDNQGPQPGAANYTNH